MMFQTHRMAGERGAFRKRLRDAVNVDMARQAIAAGRTLRITVYGHRASVATGSQASWRLG